MTATPPVLHESADLLGWISASYTVNMTITGKTIRIDHALANCAAIQNLLDQGDGVYATELRCPRTMLSRIEESVDSRQRIDLTNEVGEDELFLLPGVIATADVDLPAAGMHPLVADGQEIVSVPQGWWLAKGTESSFKPLVQELLAFNLGEKLPAGTLSVVEDSDGESPSFAAYVARDLWENRRDDRDLWNTALVGAFAKLAMPTSTMSAAHGGEHAESRIARQLRARLEEEGLVDWDDPDFDPARAATCVEKIWVKQEDDE